MRSMRGKIQFGAIFGVYIEHSNLHKKSMISKYALVALSMAMLWVSPCLKAQEDEGKDELGQAALAMRKGEFLKAETIYRRLIVKNPDDIAMKHLLCHALMNRSKFRECDSLLNAVLKLDTNNIGTHWYRALSASRQRDDTLTEQRFAYYIDKFKEHNAFDKKAYLQAGSALRRIMKDTGISYAQAERLKLYYETYIELSPTDPVIASMNDFLAGLKKRLPSEGELLIWDGVDN